MKTSFAVVGFLTAVTLTFNAHAQSLDWSRQLSTEEDEWAFNIAVDGLGGVYVVGQTNGALDLKQANARRHFA